MSDKFIYRLFRCRWFVAWLSVPRRKLFAERVTQLGLGRFHLAGRLLTKQDAAQLLSLIIARDEFFLRVRAAKIDTGRQHAEVADEIHPQIEHLRPEVGDLLVADAFLAGHVCAGDQALFMGVLPVRLTPDTAHYPIWIKCQVPDRIDSLFLSLEIVRDRRSVRSGQRRVADQIEIRFCAGGDNGEPHPEPVAAALSGIRPSSLSLG